MKIDLTSVRFGYVACASAFLSVTSCNQGEKKTETRPNVIIVLTDDQGYGDISAHGNLVLETPMLDKLYARSVRFTDFHSAPMCTPTRGQLLTGRDAFDNGATMVCMGRSMIREEVPTMADIFKASGYKTAHFGKWHLGDSYPHRPQDRGFEVTVHHGAWGIGSIADHWGNTYWNDTYWRNNMPRKYEGYCTDVWFDLSIDYIRKHDNNGTPFFIYLATNCPHGPHLCDDKYSNPYLEQGIREQVAKFYGQIANIDENMGRLLDVLDETGLAENTILIFMTDNGTVRGHEIFNANMRGHKTEPYEGGHRVPLFVRWPGGNLGKPRDIDLLTQVQDILPTLIDWCDLKIPENSNFDGSSLASLFMGNNETLDDRILVVQYENPYRPDEDKAVMWKKWRLVKNKELYDLTGDPGQKNNIADQHPQVVHKLQEFYEEWLERTMPDYQKERYIHLGSEKQNPMLLYSSDWKGSYADNNGNLFAGDRIGYWDVIIDKPGSYDFTLSRWHPDSGLPLTAPMKDRNGNNRGAIPIAYARLKIGDYDKIIQISPEQTNVIFTPVHLPEGINKLETWFLDKNLQPVCSAYYTYVERIK